MKKLKVVELFAGVGGFRLGLEAVKGGNAYGMVWSSQWEPGASTQHASDIYIHKFGKEGHSCEDIQQVIANDFKQIPDHDLLVGGFPCQIIPLLPRCNRRRSVWKEGCPMVVHL